jgi:protein ImuB
MRSWIAIHLPHLPLEAIRPRWSEPGPHAVLDREGVLAMSVQAARHGVCIGMRRNGVLMVCPDAVIHEHDPLREQDALKSIALALLQYTPEVAFAEEASLLLDVTASLRAFGGRARLCRLVRAAIHDLGFTPQVGMAPTAQGAWLLARFPQQKHRAVLRRVARMESLMRRLDALPCLLLPALRSYQVWLEGIACRTLGKLRRLPRAGLQRRVGKDVLSALDRAYGKATELFEWVEPPKTFSARIELPDRIEHAEALLFAARRLLLQMTGWLVSRQLAVSRFVLLLEHERGRSAIAPSSLEIALAEPAWREEHLVRLLKERLARFVLAAPVIAMRIDTAQAEAMLPPSGSLFPEPGGNAADYRRLLELLTARLGHDKVLVPAPRADHRPEVCNAWSPAASAPRLASVAALPAERPCWILEEPVPLSLRQNRVFYGSPLKLLRGPERIECGWWDGRLVMRDYFIAQDHASVCYWIYRTRGEDEMQWFLHGRYG